MRPLSRKDDRKSLAINFGKRNTFSDRTKHRPTIIHNKKVTGPSGTTGVKLILVFLDWEKAFDEVDQDKFIDTLKMLECQKHDQKYLQYSTQAQDL